MKRKANPRPPVRRRSAIALIVEDRRWRKDAATLRLIRRAARLALAAPPLRSLSDQLPRKRGRQDTVSVTILLADDARLKALNAQFRGRNKPTNVLSFESNSPVYLGDIAVAYETAAREACAQAKSISAHAAHLAMHGILHLHGYDHEGVRDAEIMESLETQLLGELGLADPYAARPLNRGRKAA